MASPSPQVAQALQTVSQKFNIPLWHLYAVANRESSFNPNAVNDWDWASGSQYPGTGLFQLTGAHWSTPNIDPGENNDWVGNIFDSSNFSTLTNAKDPLQNATRYAEYASRWYHYLHQKYPSWNDEQLWGGVAYNWNKGLYANPANFSSNHDYMDTYNNYADSYKQDIATFGQINTGGPTVVGGMSGPVSGATAAPPKTPQQLREEAISLAQTLGAQRNMMLRPTIGASVQQGRPGMAMSTQSYRLPSMALRSQSSAIPRVGLGSNSGSVIPRISLSSGLSQVMAPLALRMGRSFLPALGLGSVIPNLPGAIGGNFGGAGNFLGNVGEAALERIRASTISPWEGFYNKLKSIF